MTKPSVPAQLRDARFQVGRDGWSLGALILLATALRVPTLGLQSYWYDEVATVDLVQSSLRDLPGGIRASESTPPLYYVLAWFWARVFGTAEIGLRLLSAVAGIATIPVAYLCGRALVSARAGVAVAALATVNPVLVWYSQEARAYALFTFLSAASFLFFARAAQRPSHANVILWSASSCLALTTHYFAIFLVLPEAAWLIVTIGFRRRVLVPIAAIVATSAALVPLAVVQGRRGTDWIADIALDERVGHGLERLVLPSFSPWWAGVTGAHVSPGRWFPALFIIILAGATLAVSGSPSERRGGRVSFTVAAIAFLLPLLGSLTQQSDRLLDRNLLAIWLPLNLGIAAAFSARRARWLGLVPLVMLCLASAAIAVAVSAQPELQRDDWRTIAREVRRAEGIVIVFPFYQARPLEHYLRTLSPLPEDGTASETITVVTPSDRLPGLFRLPKGFTPAKRTRIQHFTLFSFRAREPRVVTRADLQRTSDEGVFTFLVHDPERTFTAARARSGRHSRGRTNSRARTVASPAGGREGVERLGAILESDGRRLDHRRSARCTAIHRADSRRAHRRRS